MKAGIAGAGLVGRLLALQLLKKGWDVTLFDRDHYQGTLSCAMAAAGMLTPIAEVENSDHTIMALGQRSLQRWPEIIREVNRPVYFQQTGSLLLAHRQDEAELERIIRLINTKLLIEPAFSEKPYQPLQQNDILQLEPELSTFYSGLYLPIEGQIANDELMNALQHTLLENGVTWHIQQTVHDVKPGKIILEQDSPLFDMAFDCRGLGAKTNFSDLRGIRGETIWCHAPDVNISRPIRLLHPRYRLYIVPRPNQHYIIGSSEIESEDLSPISVRSTLEFLSAAYSLHKGFAEARILQTRVNCRPVLPDNLPRIKYTDGFMAINGLYRHGFLIAPALIDDALQRLATREEMHANHYA